MINDKITEIQKVYPFIREIELFRNIVQDRCSDFSFVLTLQCSSSWGEGEKKQIKFLNIRDFTLGNIENLCQVYLSVLDISDRQLEGLKYKVTEIENDLFSFYCEEIDF